MGKKFSFLMAAATGGAVVWFLDPKNGSARRGGASKGLSAVSRQGGSVLQAGSQKASGKGFGAVKEVIKRQPDNPNPDDGTLTDRVETEIFRDPETSRQHINISVIKGVVTVRGEQPTQSAIDSLVKRIEAIPHVKGVENLLHLPGTPAPNKESSIEAS